MTKLSVITVTYQNLSGLAKTLESVRRQTYPAIELVIVDGRSSDGTVEFLEEKATELDRWVSEPDDGIYDAMNKGIRLSTGEWLQFLNAGDTFARATSAEAAMRAADGCLLVYGGVRVFDRNGRLLGDRRALPLDRRPFGSGMIESCHQAMFVHRSIAVPYETRYRISGDHAWAIEVARSAAGRVKRLDETLVCYSLGGMSSYSLRGPAEILASTARAYGLCYALTRLPQTVIRIAANVVKRLFGLSTLRRYRASPESE